MKKNCVVAFASKKGAYVALLLGMFVTDYCRNQVLSLGAYLHWNNTTKFLKGNRELPNTNIG